MDWSWLSVILGLETVVVFFGFDEDIYVSKLKVAQISRTEGKRLGMEITFFLFCFFNCYFLLWFAGLLGHGVVSLNVGLIFDNG